MNANAACKKTPARRNGLARGGGEGDPPACVARLAARLAWSAYLAFGTEASVVMRRLTSSLTAGA